MENHPKSAIESDIGSTGFHILYLLLPFPRTRAMERFLQSLMRINTDNPVTLTLHEHLKKGITNLPRKIAGTMIIICLLFSVEGTGNGFGRFRRRHENIIHSAKLHLHVLLPDPVSPASGTKDTHP